MASQGWASDLAACLIGQPVDLPGSVTGARAVLDALAERGWPSARIVEVAHARFEAEQEWPFPVSRDVVAQGPAQWYALVADARALLGLEGISRPPSSRTTLDADERRLLGDVPPHWGRTR
ncbi:MAG TPA: hypothetical protein VFK68_10710 [Propionibacteriaceae bacterium]|nr:hypothetical protein [Propionibacteriaceae bacterium]